MKTRGTNFVNLRWSRMLMLSFLLSFLLGCEKDILHPEKDAVGLIEEIDSKAKKKNFAEPYEFQGAVFDIASAPDGSIWVGVNDGENREIRAIKNGKIIIIAEIDAMTNIQGIAPIGAGNAFVTTAGANLATDGELYRVSKGKVRMVADLAAFERENDPDAFFGVQWKNQLCEGIDGFDAGPQNNPFKVAAYSGGTAFVADAAGNTLLSAKTNGEIDWKAIFTPPVDENGDYLIRWYAEDEGESIPCYVQPVPTSVAIGPDGYIYVGELTGAVAGSGLPIGLSRVWKIPADANNVVCTVDSGECELLIDGLTSVMDIAIGPDGLLYVVEFDEMSWISSFVPGLATGGTINIYERDGTLVDVITGLSFPSAITFDKEGNLWVLENNNIPERTPTVRMIDYDEII